MRKGKVEQAAANTHTRTLTHTLSPKRTNMASRTQTKAKQQNNRNAANETVMEENNKRQAPIKVPNAKHTFEKETEKESVREAKLCETV